MLITHSPTPDTSPYCIGAYLLRKITNTNIGLYDSLTLYEEFTEESNMKIGFNHFLYALDWLFLLGLVELDSTGKILRCF